jgi:hypothetical protein
VLAANFDTMSQEQKSGITFVETDQQGNTTRMTLGEWMGDSQVRANALKNARDAVQQMRASSQPQMQQRAIVLDEAIAEAEASGGRFTTGLETVIRSHLQMEMQAGAAKVQRERQDAMVRAAGAQSVRSGLESTGFDLKAWVRSTLPDDGSVGYQTAKDNAASFLQLAKSREGLWRERHLGESRRRAGSTQADAAGD